MLKKIALGSMLALAVTTTAASAYERGYRPHYGYGHGHGYRGDDIDRRQAEQQRLIEQGRRSGELTRREYWQLQAEQRRIAEIERRYRADGHLSASERAHLKALQDQAGRHIYRETHDAERRGSGWWRRWW